MTRQELCALVPDLALTDADFERRFGHLDLDDARARMKPAMFAVFVRYCGVIEGSPDLDVVELTRMPDDR